jgi:hypothetical protein
LQLFRRLLCPITILILVGLSQLHCGGGHTATPPQAPAPAITSFTATKNLISAGTSTTLTAEFTGGTGLVSNGVGSITSGTPISTGNLTTTTIFILTVTNATGSTATQAVLVSVVPNAVITAFSVAKPTITNGTGTTLSYAFTGGTGIITPGIGAVTSGGTTNVSPTTATTYTLTVTDPAGGTVTQGVSIAVLPYAHITSFTATPSLIAPGSSSVLTAVFENGLGALDHNLGTITSSGAGLGTGALTATTTYTLVVTNSVGDPVSATATVTIGTVGSFAPTGAMGTGRHDHSATLLPNGKVLVAGGVLEEGASGFFNIIASAELYDPATKTFTATGTMGTARSYHTETLLQNGKVLVTGGNAGTVSAEVYEPSTGTFTPTGFMRTARSGHKATLLPNGKVLVTGGKNLPSVYANTSAELYDPATGLFSDTGSMGDARSNHMATLLPNSKVLIVGGYNGSAYLASAEIYDPSTETFAATGAMSTGTDGITAPLLPNGKVLVVSSGGAELYDPSTRTFAATGPRITAGSGGLTLLQTGMVLLVTNVGGYDSASAEVYVPVTGTFTTTGSPGAVYRGHTATLLQSGKVLLAGGSYGVMVTQSDRSAKLYDPTTLQ